MTVGLDGGVTIARALVPPKISTPIEKSKNLVQLDKAETDEHYILSTGREARIVDTFLKFQLKALT